MFGRLRSEQTLNFSGFVNEDGVTVTRHHFNDQSGRIAASHTVLFVQEEFEDAIVGLEADITDYGFEKVTVDPGRSVGLRRKGGRRDADPRPGTGAGHENAGRPPLTNPSDIKDKLVWFCQRCILDVRTFQRFQVLRETSERQVAEIHAPPRPPPTRSSRTRYCCSRRMLLSLSRSASIWVTFS